MATFISYAIVRRARKDADCIQLTPVPIDLIQATPHSTTTATPSVPTHDSPTNVPPQPPPHPEEAVCVGDLPKAAQEWKRAAETPFVAGRHGPVRLPLEKDLPLCPPGHVLVPDTALGLLLSSKQMPDHHLSYIKKKTSEEVATHSIEQVTDWAQVKVLIPLFVVEQEQPNGTKKLRIIFDGRALNAYLREATGAVKYESVRDVLLHRARVCTKLDLSAAFRHVRVEEEQKRLLGFTLDGKLYRYACLPFGLSWSPALYLASLRPAIEAIRRHKVRIVWYVDDFLLLADSKEELDAALALVLRTLADHGWQAAADKTFCHAYTSITFLGLLVTINSDGRVDLRVPRAKRDKVLTAVTDALATGTIKEHELQRLLGRLGFIRIVLREIGFCRASLDGAVAAATRSGNTTVHVIGRLKEDLLGLRALLIDDAVLLRNAANPADFADFVEHNVYSDASAFGWGVLRVDQGGPFRVPPPIVVDLVDSKLADVRGWSRTGLFSAIECAASSAAREIMAVVRGIVALDLRNCRLKWHSDSTCATAAINKWASSAPGVADALTELFSEVCRRNIDIDVVHVRRELSLMPVADYLSRRGWRDRQAEWSFATSDVARVLGELKHRCVNSDLFASLRNHRFKHWCSQWLEQGSIGDAFYTPWWGRHWWAFPPLSQRSRVLQKLVSYRRSAAAAVISSSSQSSSQHQRRHLSVVLIITPVADTDPDAVLFRELTSVIVRSVTLWRPDTSPTRLLLPSLRLIGDRGTPAPLPPPWPLIAHLVKIADVQ